MKKKANLQDPVTAGVILFSTVITLFIVWTVMNNMGTAFKGNSEMNNTQLIADYDDHQESLTNGVDYGFLIILIVLPILSFFLAKNIPSEPIFFVISFLFMGFFIIMMAILSNLYGAMLDNALFATFVANLTIIPMFMPYLPYYGLIYSFIVSVGLFSKNE